MECLTASIALAASELLMFPLLRDDVEVEVVEAVAREPSLGAGVLNDGGAESESAPVRVPKEGKPALMSSKRSSLPSCFAGLPACCTSTQHFNAMLTWLLGMDATHEIDQGRTAPQNMQVLNINLFQQSGQLSGAVQLVGLLCIALVMIDMLQARCSGTCKCSGGYEAAKDDLGGDLLQRRQASHWRSLQYSC